LSLVGEDITIQLVHGKTTRRGVQKHYTSEIDIEGEYNGKYIK